MQIPRCLIPLVILFSLTACAHQATMSRSDDPRSVVAASVAAYNQRDFEAFRALLAPNVQLYEFPGELLYATPAEALEAYRKLFREAKGLQAHVSHRVVQGKYVIDQETIHGMPGKEPTEGAAIYKVERGKIVAIWFIE